MKFDRTSLLFVVIGYSSLCACAPQTRFEWGNYETSLYAYYKSPSDRAQYEEALTKAIDAGKASGRIAPGLLAELGYLRLEDGKFGEAKEYFEEEIRYFPESKSFLTGVIERMTNNPSLKNSGGAAS